MRYRDLDHTSDLGMEIAGRDLPELFRNACFALFDNILNLEAVQTPDLRSITLESATLQELFLDWLRELLFRFSTEYFAVKDATVNIRPGSDAESWRLAAVAKGEKFDPKRHRVKIEIKTPTYHMYAITKDENGYRATVILDV